MKALLTPVILALVAVMLGATLVLTNGKTSRVPPSTLMVPPNQIFGFSKPVPDHLSGLQTPRAFPPTIGHNSTGHDIAFSKPTPLDLNQQPTPHLLPPGVYQTYPWTIILVVPGAGMNARDFTVKPDTNSPMPIIIPHVEVVPIS